MDTPGDRRGDQQVPVWIYLVGFVVLGCALSMSGPALSHLRDRVGTDDGGISLVFVGSSSGYMVGSFLGGRFLDRGHGHQMWADVHGDVGRHDRGDLATAATRRHVHRVRPCWAPSCGVGDVSGNTLVVWSRPDAPGAALNALHLFFALGALSAPILTNRAIAWTGSLWPVAVPLGALTVLCVIRAVDDTRAGRRRARRITAHEGEHGASVRRGQLLIVGLFFFVYVALEVGFANWIHTYVEQIGYGDANTATGVTATFWVGFSVGRVIAIWLASAVQRRLDLGRLDDAGTDFIAGVGGRQRRQHRVVDRHVLLRYVDRPAIRIDDRLRRGSLRAVGRVDIGLRRRCRPRRPGDAVVARTALRCARREGAAAGDVLAACVVTIAAGLWVRHIVRVSDGQRPPVTSMKAPVT